NFIEMTKPAQKSWFFLCPYWSDIQILTCLPDILLAPRKAHWHPLCGFTGTF
ncbi:hypothetical protein QE390_000172, partial [Siphonobacter sp. SORGH_AS 1065]|nr:hypothetical protein [Siphonobacter sp. SORGH_AS_1065]